MDDINQIRETQSENLISSLRDATERGNAVWFHLNPANGEVFCFIANELILFQLEDGTESNENSFKETYGIAAHIRNRSLVWLKSSDGWDEISSLIELGKRNRIENTKYQEYSTMTIDNLIDEIAAL